MQGIIIQGPTKYANEIIHLYEGIPNVVWSTWEGEDIELIQSKGIDVIQSIPPTIPGHLNINYQTLSTYNGIKYLKSKGVTEALKIRGDLKPNNVKLLLDILKNKPLSFLAICKPGVRPLYYELEYTHTSFDFPVDLFLYGSLDNLEKCFNFQIDENLPIPPESLIAYNYFSNSGLKFDLSYDAFISNGISFFMKECLEHNIKVEWLKNNIKLIKYHSDLNLYNY
jgi:hypothetical protein